jgi:uncharacterized membrane protein YfcA
MFACRETPGGGKETSLDAFLLFLLVGFVAQAIDGALGMAYGVVTSTVLITLGVPVATASATAHAAEVFTTAASAGSHIAHRNVNWRFLVPLAGAGMIGGALGAYVLTGVDGDAIRPYVVAYLGFMGVMILLRAHKRPTIRKVRQGWAAPIGLVGGFADAAGGGGWGSTVTSTLVGAGKEPRMAIGTANAAEFFVTVAISVAFLVALLTGRWEQAGDLREHAQAVAGLVVGGLCAAPLAGWVTKKVPLRAMTVAVGSVVILLAAHQTARLMGLF